MHVHVYVNNYSPLYMVPIHFLFAAYTNQESIMFLKVI